MLKNILLSTVFLMPYWLVGQDFVCGYKDECNCARVGIESAFETGDFIFEGKVLSVDTVSIGEIITTAAKLDVEQHQDTIASCAKTVLKKEKVIITKIQVNETIKGAFQKTIINICTPLERKNCGYNNFIEKERFIVYGSEDETADLFFTYTMEDDFFILKNEYRYWTNFCRRTSKTNDVELKNLRKLKQ